MILTIVFLLLGIVLILVGADKLTDGAASLAAKFNISDLVIGLTVVALGTSMPEFVISFLSALKGSSGLAIGNIVGSNIFNTLVIVGISALFVPIDVKKSTVSKDIPFTILASIALFAMASDILFDGGAENVITRSEGIILLGFFAVFISYSLAIARDGVDDSEDSSIPLYSVWKCILFILIGLAGLIIGGELFVQSASDIARALGISEAVIGLTIVAAGTSLPELATSISAARKKKSGMVIGNVIGSNIFNIFWILGASSLVIPLPLGSISMLDLSVLLGSGLLLWFFAHTKYKVSRAEGALMTLIYIAYIAYLVSQVV